MVVGSGLVCTAPAAKRGVAGAYTRRLGFAAQHTRRAILLLESRLCPSAACFLFFSPSRLDTGGGGRPLLLVYCLLRLFVVLRPLTSCEEKPIWSASYNAVQPSVVVATPTGVQRAAPAHLLHETHLCCAANAVLVASSPTPRVGMDGLGPSVAAWDDIFPNVALYTAAAAGVRDLCCVPGFRKRVRVP